jgi:hypothetical protein
VNKVLGMASEQERPFDPARLNAQFYAANPPAYFRSRLHLLALAAGRPSELVTLLEAGVEYEGLRFTREGSLATEGNPNLDAAFLVTESQVLLHHASEALIRLFFGHADLPPCPWLECADFRGAAAFRKEVDRLASSLWPAQLKEAVADVFLGGTPDEVPAAWSETAESAERLLRVLAKRLNEDAHMYNSTKHGMAVLSGDSSVAVLSEEGQHVAGGSGPSVSFLESIKRPGGDEVWSLTTNWFSIQQAMFLTSLAITQMEALWQVARVRYVDADLAGMPMVTKEAIDAALFEMRPAGVIHQFSHQVAVVKPAKGRGGTT